MSAMNNKLTDDIDFWLTQTDIGFPQEIIDFLEELKKRRNADSGGEWTKTKPDSPCVFVTRSKSMCNYYEYDYELYILEMVDGENEAGQKCQYLGILDHSGEEWGAYEEFQAQEYFVIPQHPQRKDEA